MKPLNLHAFTAMKELEIGDKLYNTKQEGFNDFIRYSFSEVVELTKTLAVLRNGVKLINQPKISYITEGIGYSVNRHKGVHWHLVSLEAIRTAQIENEKIAAHDWFENKEFSLQEKQWIYKQFKKLGETN
ncbi:pyruvate kinase [Zobellia laminariae]|uniref:pyruvate kinase n=2 Tax=Zobellia laminariae TaxID=248906 RepID=UPI0026F44975|nr:pyruvate kinase [Zobellia laminariae]WKX75737.1 pyruvate kinase [Zobellia laminariae]